MSNYPPGVSAGHPHFNPPDTSHEHRWEPLEEPLFEDGAVIFRDECVHETALDTEPGYEGERIVTESISCNATRSFRFDPTEVTKIMEDGPDITIKRSVKDKGILSTAWEEALITVESVAFPHGGNVDIIEMDPDRRAGSVVVEYGGYRLKYEPIVEDDNE